jgi:hypothetical protein
MGKVFFQTHFVNVCQGDDQKAIQKSNKLEKSFTIMFIATFFFPTKWHMKKKCQSSMNPIFLLNMYICMYVCMYVCMH